MRLAVLFQCPPSALPGLLSIRDYMELARFYCVEPWDGLRGELATGIQTAVIAGMFSKGRQPKPTDFTPFVKARRGQTPEQMDMVRRQFVASNPGLFVKADS